MGPELLRRAICSEAGGTGRAILGTINLNNSMQKPLVGSDIIPDPSRISGCGDFALMISEERDRRMQSD
jgi:hypothetical protein